MPTTSTSHTSALNRPTQLVARLSSDDKDVRLTALRELKNQIIGSPTKKLAYIKLAAVPAVASVLSDSSDDDSDLLVQSAAALGSFACGLDAGVQAVLDADAMPHLLGLLSNRNQKVIDSGARSLRMIYQSKLAPKYDFLQEGNVEFLLSLLNSDNENVTVLGTTIVTHSCETSAEQKRLCEAGLLEKLLGFLDGSLGQRDSSLESLVTVLKDNPDIISRFVESESRRALNYLKELAKDRSYRTRLLACMCLIVIKNTSHYLEDVGIKRELISHLLELLEDPCQVGDEAFCALSSLIEEKEDMQRLAFEANVIDKLCFHLQKGPIHSRRLQGILLALATACSKLECCRSKLIKLEAVNTINDALNNDSDNVQIAACICLRNVSRSIESLSAGRFMNETIVVSLLRLLQDPSSSVQIAALGAISNIVVDFATQRSIFIQYGGIKHLVQLSKAMDATVRTNSLWALKNLTFLADSKCKENVLMELTAVLLENLICDPEPCVQEQALALVRNLIDGNIDSIDYILGEDGLILDAVGRQLQRVEKTETAMQGMYVLGNISSGNEAHKDLVMKQLLPQSGNSFLSFLVKFLQSNDLQLRTASIWVIVNLTISSSPGSCERIGQLRNAGVVSQLKNMVYDPCLDVKLQVRTLLRQFDRR